MTKKFIMYISQPMLMGNVDREEGWAISTSNVASGSLIFLPR